MLSSSCDLVIAKHYLRLLSADSNVSLNYMTIRYWSHTICINLMNIWRHFLVTRIKDFFLIFSIILNNFAIFFSRCVFAVKTISCSCTPRTTKMSNIPYLGFKDCFLSVYLSFQDILPTSVIIYTRNFLGENEVIKRPK